MSSSRLETIRYEDLEPRLRTGDILLFHGDSRRSRVIETVTRSKFSHVGMIVRTDVAKAPLLWQSDPRAVTEDIRDHRNHGGAQLNELAAALKVMTSAEYGDTPHVRQLIVERTADFERAALAATALLDERSFPTPLKLLKKWIVGHLHLASSEKRMDCAEVVTVTYQQMGLLPARPPADAYWPRTFSAEHERLPLLKGAALGPQLRVLYSRSESEAH